MCRYDRRTVFPYSRQLQCTRTYTPHAPGSLCHVPSAPLTIVLEHDVSYGVTRMAITVPRAPSPPWGVTPPRVVSPRPRPALPGPHRSYGLLRQTSPLSRPTLCGLGCESLQGAVCPCWAE